MVTVKEHYEAFPYPARDPADEATRLITGSPSHPYEIDHFLFGGRRDWQQPLRALVAGGGTGDGLIQLAQLLTAAGKPYQITYLDLSTASRRIAEARAAARGLGNITFHTASLLDAAEYGPFDYIDCCGVLHHLPDPDAGFAALRAACADDGGMGFMVYAPLGRAGVYPLQEAFGALFAGLPPDERLARAKEVLGKLPAGHPFRNNPNVADHRSGDAGFYDLLLHGQDRPYSVPALLEALARADWDLSGMVMSALYDPSRFAAVPDTMDAAARMALAENLRGDLKMHVGYARPRGSETQAVASGTNRNLIPHLKGVQARQLAAAVARGRVPSLTLAGQAVTLRLAPATAPLLAGIDGRRSLRQIAEAANVDPVRFGALWGPLEAELTGWGLLLYSALRAKGA